MGYPNGKVFSILKEQAITEGEGPSLHGLLDPRGRSIQPWAITSPRRNAQTCSNELAKGLPNRWEREMVCSGHKTPSSTSQESGYGTDRAS